MTTPHTEQALKARHRPAHALRTAASHAAFLLPHLKPGMALLDLGCGPGSITVGLAAAVSPGSTCAIDLDPGLADGTEGISVRRGDARELPYPDATFDAIYCGALLQHLPDPLAALREAHRVARPGAVIAIADADRGGYLLTPSDPLLVRSFDLMAKMHTGNPEIGRELRGLLTRAGFARCEVAARTMHYGNADEVRGFAGFNASWFTTAAIADAVVAKELASREEMTAIGEAWREWGEQPDAFFAGFWCEAIGWVE